MKNANKRQEVAQVNTDLLNSELANRAFTPRTVAKSALNVLRQAVDSINRQLEAKGMEALKGESIEVKVENEADLTLIQSIFSAKFWRVDIASEEARELMFTPLNDNEAQFERNRRNNDDN